MVPRTKLCKRFCHRFGPTTEVVTIEVLSDGTSPDELTVVRLLQNPLGEEAPPGERGDMVRVSDGEARLYLLASEFDMISPATLRWMLARERLSPPAGDRARTGS